MVKLPDPYATGPGPQRSGRPQARIDATALAEGGESFGRAVGRGGEAIARAVTGEAELGRAEQQAGAELARSTERVGDYAGRNFRQAAEAEGGAVMRGGAAMADAIRSGADAERRAAATLGEGMDKLGKGIQDYTVAREQLDFARARADFFTNKTILDGTLDKDNDYPTLKDRYEKKIGEIRATSAALVGSPQMRERFMLDTQNPAQQGIERAGAQAFKLETSDRLAEAGQRLKILKNAALTAKEEDRPAIIAAGNDLINGLQNSAYITPREAQRLRAHWTEDYAIAAVEAKPAEERINLLRDAPSGRNATLDRIGGVENATGDPAARNPNSTAMGNFQFIEKTWLSTVRDHRPDLLQGRSEKDVLALRADSKLSREMAGYLLDDNSKVLRDNGIVPTPANQYLAHFLGADGAVKVLKADPGTPVADVIDGQAIAANRSILAGKTTDSVVDWAKGKMGGAARGTGSIIDYIPEDKRVGMLNRATAQYLTSQRNADSETALEQFAVKDLVKNDLSSTLNTGQGIDLDPERLRRAYGSAAVVKWEQDREDAHAVWVNTHDLSSLTEQQLNQRLDAIKPAAGDANYARKQAVHDTVSAKTDELRKQRREDPAASVSDDPSVQNAQGALNDKDPATYQTLAKVRLAAQEKAGIPEEAQSPITKAEAMDYAVPLRRMLPGQEREVLTSVGQQLKERYGDNADAAFEYTLRVHRVDTDTARAASRVMRKLGLGEPPDQEQARTLDQAQEVDAAQRAVNATGFTDPMSGGTMAAPGTASPAQPAKPLPPNADIRALLSNPNLATRFDEKWGKGSSKKLIETYGAK